ncbi:hypothetical protein EXIGLDRAFT_722700 [Exidia glandulosa HHB12029]|uniref:Uncharacterized protein n=1 Tax=Exidia glandulosa HHB12029 TaxID=1314781 RepID=A0A165N298_EXIGL|nr:hypothetical protein EXIGLDRAFT_722700 [Exidia glandulosa HHB12029]
MLIPLRAICAASGARSSNTRAKTCAWTSSSQKWIANSSKLLDQPDLQTRAASSSATLVQQHGQDRTTCVNRCSAAGSVL